MSAKKAMVLSIGKPALNLAKLEPSELPGLEPFTAKRIVKFSLKCGRYKGNPIWSMAEDGCRLPATQDK